MIYKMTRKMFRELAIAISSKENPARKSAVIGYINQVFGLCGEIKDITLV